MGYERRLLERVEGKGSLEVAGEFYKVGYVLRIYRDFNDGVPSLKSANGTLNFPELGMVTVRYSGQEMTLHLIDRSAKIFLADSHGDFTVSGGIE